MNRKFKRTAFIWKRWFI